MDSIHTTETSRSTSRGPKQLSHALRLGLRWGLIGLPLGMFIGGAAGLSLAMIANSLHGIGGDNYSGPISQAAEQEVWACICGLGLGIAFVGGSFAIVCGLMGCLGGIVEAKSAARKKSKPEKPDYVREDNEGRSRHESRGN